MSRPILSRPRTRVYGCNYDKGESYYRPAIESLDRKYKGRTLFPDSRNSFAEEIAARRSDIGTRDLSGPRFGALGHNDLELDLELNKSINRQSLPTIGSFCDGSEFSIDDAEDTVFDIRGQRTSRGSRRLNDYSASDILTTTNRLQTQLHLRSEQSEDKLTENSRGKRVTLNDNGEASRQRTRFNNLKTKITEPYEDAQTSVLASSAKWTKIKSSDSSINVNNILENVSGAAASRAKKSKARLHDLEQEMEEIAEKQAKREKRAAALRALVNEANSTTDNFLTNSSSSSSSLIQSEKKNEKHVTF